VKFIKVLILHILICLCQYISDGARGSIPDGVIGIFHLHIPSGRTMALGLIQPLKEMGTRNISWCVKVAGV
jgi:hypothetical protein